MGAAVPVFEAELVRWAGPAAWTFVEVPDELVGSPPGPFGRVPVTATVDGTEWPTSVWWDRRSDAWLLAVPARVRRDKDDGDTVTVAVRRRSGTTDAASADRWGKTSEG